MLRDGSPDGKWKPLHLVGQFNGFPSMRSHRNELFCSNSLMAAKRSPGCKNILSTSAAFRYSSATTGFRAIDKVRFSCPSQSTRKRLPYSEYFGWLGMHRKDIRLPVLPKLWQQCFRTFVKQQPVCCPSPSWSSNSFVVLPSPPEAWKQPFHYRNRQPVRHSIAFTKEPDGKHWCRGGWSIRQFP